VKVLVASRDRVTTSTRVWPRISLGGEGRSGTFVAFTETALRGSVRAWRGFPRRFSNKVPQPQGA
jgi:hypothetical protein